MESKRRRFSEPTDRLVLVLQVADDFSLDEKAAADAVNERVIAWETMMWKYQKPLAVGAPRREVGSHATHLFAECGIRYRRRNEA